MNNAFRPDYKNLVSAALNKKPPRLPLYEHKINPEFMEKFFGFKFAQMLFGDQKDVRQFFSHYCDFYKTMTYDTVSFEVRSVEILPGYGAINGGRPGPIQNRSDFNSYPWEDLSCRFWSIADIRYQSLISVLPDGMSLVGGIGNGIFEISEDLVGYEYLSYMLADDPELLGMIYTRIGDLMLDLWGNLIKKYGQAYCVFRFGDDLGFKTGLLPTKGMFTQYILPQYARLIPFLKSSEKPFLWHSCGNIFELMEYMIDTGIDAKHSNEDQIAPFEKWISLYGDKIALFGGIDVSVLCQSELQDIYSYVIEKGRIFRSMARGFALGSGNSIPEYVPLDGYLAMIKAAQQLRSEQI